MDRRLRGTDRRHRTGADTTDTGRLTGIHRRMVIRQAPPHPGTGDRRQDSTGMVTITGRRPATTGLLEEMARRGGNGDRPVRRTARHPLQTAKVLTAAKEGAAGGRWIAAVIMGLLAVIRILTEVCNRRPALLTCTDQAPKHSADLTLAGATCLCVCDDLLRSVRFWGANIMDDCAAVLSIKNRPDHIR